MAAINILRVTGISGRDSVESEYLLYTNHAEANAAMTELLERGYDVELIRRFDIMDMPVSRIASHVAAAFYPCL